MKRKKPLVSVIMTAYNAQAFVAEALDSLINQTYRKMEIIVVDDGSTDDTFKIIKSYDRRFKRVKAYQIKKNSGPSAASNFALKKTGGKYIARLDADDVAYWRRIEKQVAFMEENPRVEMLGGQCNIIDKKGKIIGEKKFPLKHEEIREALFMVNAIAHPACMFRKKTFVDNQIRYEKKYFVSHDLKILFRLLALGGKLANIEDTVIKYRVQPGSITHKDPKRTFRETKEIRHWALFKTGYSPSVKGVLVHIFEMGLVWLLPNWVISKLFQLWRIKRVIEAPVNIAYRLVMRPIALLVVLLNSKLKL